MSAADVNVTPPVALASVIDAPMVRLPPVVVTSTNLLPWVAISCKLIAEAEVIFTFSAEAPTAFESTVNTEETTWNAPASLASSLSAISSAVISKVALVAVIIESP